MTVHNVAVIAGYRLIFTKAQWTEFCNKLHDLVNSEHESDSGSDSDHSKDSDSGSDSGSDSDSDSDHSKDSGSDAGSDSDRSGCDCGDSAEDKVWDNLTVFFKDVNATAKIARVLCQHIEYKSIICFHKKEGMDRMIDIGFSLGEFSINGDYEGSHVSFANAMESMKNAQNDTFMEWIKNEFFWKYCSNKRGVELLGQADDCLYCS